MPIFWATPGSWGPSLVAAMMSSSISFLFFAKPSFPPREEEEEEEEVSADKMPPAPLSTYMPKKVWRVAESPTLFSLECFIFYMNLYLFRILSS